MFTCVIRYKTDPEKMNEFKEYGALWMELVEKYGGKHHGYFYPPSAAEKTGMPGAAFSFAGMGSEADENEGFAFFSFDSAEAYDAYREAVTKDEACIKATEKFTKSPCYTDYERAFLVPSFPNTNQNG